MTMQRRDLPPIGMSDLPDEGTRTQVAALCWRMEDGKPKVLLVTSRETGRWVLPKGWPERGTDAHQDAAREAWEEAGVRGEASPECLGFYAYNKVLGPDKGIPCVVAVYPLEVTALKDTYPEVRERRRKWFSPAKAAEKVAEPELKALLAAFDPARR